MTALAQNDASVIQSTLSASEMQEQLLETERQMDAYLARITRLQMLLHLEESRLLTAQEEFQELKTLLGNPDIFND